MCQSLLKIWRNARQAQIFSLDKAIWRRNTFVYFKSNQRRPAEKDVLGWRFGRF